jgi:predicted RNA-binding Zn ribbon-like protein
MRRRLRPRRANFALMVRAPSSTTPPPGFTFLGGRLWLDLVNTDDTRQDVRVDTIGEFDRFVAWLLTAGVIDADRAEALNRRAIEQPSGAAAALVEVRRLRAALRALAEKGKDPAGVAAREATLGELNRILSRAVGTRRIDQTEEGRYVRRFIPVGDAFGGLVIPIVESAVDSFIRDEFAKIRACAGRRCGRHFADDTRSRTRRWCEMRGCGNRAKARRRRQRQA